MSAGHSSPGFLHGARALITGGSGGIGAGICKVAAREGARVAFTWSRNRGGAEETEALVRANGSDCLSIAADLTDRSETTRVVEEVEAAWGGVDLLVNNAGVSESVPFVLLDDADVDELMEVNLFAALRLSRRAAKSMIRQKRGRIVNVSSIAGSRCIPGPVHYAMSKSALEGLTRSLAQELGPYGVLVNAIAAGIFEGGLRSTIPENHQRRYLENCALSRFGAPEECGELACWLGSERNTYVNGSVVFQDGGTVA